MAVIRLRVVVLEEEEDQEKEAGKRKSGKVRLLVPVEVEEKKTTVRMVQFQIEERLSDVGIEGGLGELCLNPGGFTLGPGDWASEALRDDDEVVGVTRAAWLARELPLCTQTLCKLVKADYARPDDKPRFVEVGATKRNRLFAVAGDGLGRNARGATADVFRVLDMDQLFAEDPVDILDFSGDGWFATVRVERSGDDATRRIVLRNKPSHAEFAAEAYVDVARVNGGKLSGVGTPQRVRDPDAVDSSDASSPTLRPDQSTGPRFLPEEEASSSAAASPLQDDSTENWLPEWHVALDDDPDSPPKVEAYQQVRQKTLSQFIAINLAAVNRHSEKALRFETVSATLAGVPAASARVARRSGYCSYSAVDNYALDTCKADRLAVLVRFDVPLGAGARVWNAQSRRLHKSLPAGAVALEFKTFEGHVKKVAVPCPRTPLELAGREHVAGALVKRRIGGGNPSSSSDGGDDLVAYVECDDLDAEARLVWGCAKATDANGDFLKCTRSPHRSPTFTGGGAVFLRLDALAKLAYRATQQGLQEIQVDDLSYRDNNADVAGVCAVQVFALVHARRVVALRVHLATNTGTADHSFRLPRLQPAPLRVSPA